MAEGRRSRRSGERRRRRRAAVETSSGGVVFRRIEEVPHFLLIRDPYQNWGLPKGHIEGEETPAEAALREVAEETGLDELEIVAELPTIDWYYRDHGRLIHKFCHFFLVESGTGEVRPQLDEGITDCIWRPFPSALQTLSYANAREVLRAAGARLGDAPADGADDAARATPGDPVGEVIGDAPAATRGEPPANGMRPR